MRGRFKDKYDFRVERNLVDDCQNWDLVHSEVGDGMIIFETTRDIDTGDLQDGALNDDSHL